METEDEAGSHIASWRENFCRDTPYAIPPLDSTALISALSAKAIPDIFFFTIPLKLILFGVALLSYGIKVGLEIGMIEANCKDIPYEILIEKLRYWFGQVPKGIRYNHEAIILNLNAINTVREKMKEAFKKMGTQLDKILFEIYQNYHEIIDVSRTVDKTYAGIQKNINEVDRNFDAITKDTTETDRILEYIEQTFHVSKSLSEKSDKEFDWFEKLEELVRRRSVQEKTSELVSVLKEFSEIREDLGRGNHVSKLIGDDGYYGYFKNGKTPKASRSLYTVLNDILNEEIAVPKTANDDAAFTALHLLFLGTNAYIQMFQYVMLSNVLAMKENYKKSDVEKFNQSYRDSVSEFYAFQNILCGIGNEDGLIGEVIRVHRQIKKLPFIKDRPQVFENLKRNIKYFRNIQEQIANIIYTCHDAPTNRIRLKTISSGVNAPFLDWRHARRVRYAIQHVREEMVTLISDWSLPFTINDKALPKLDIGNAPLGTIRVIFRQFDHDKPKLVGVVHDPNQTKFHDFDRDLYDAVLESNLKLANINAGVLIEVGANVTAKFENGRQVIHAAAKAGNMEMVRHLLQKGIDINARDDAGYSPLHIAAENGDRKLVQDLIRLGADVRASSHLNWTASHVAAKHGHVKTLQVLEKADLNARAAGGFTPLHVAVNTRRKRAVELLILDEKADINARSDKHLTPLHLAVLGHDRRTVQILLSNAKCDANIRAHGGLTALHLAVISGDENIVEQLVQSNATNINAKSDEGWSSLHFAIPFKKRVVIEKLLNSSEIDVNLEGKDKITPLQLANKIGEHAITLDLINHGAQVKPDERSIPSSRQSALQEILHFQDQEKDALRSHTKAKKLSDFHSNSTFYLGNLNISTPSQEKTFVDFKNSSQLRFRENSSSLKYDRQADTAVPSDQISSSPSMLNNILFVKWLFYMFGRRSFVERMEKVKGRVENVRTEDSHRAERLLHQGMARYGQLQS